MYIQSIMNDYMILHKELHLAGGCMNIRHNVYGGHRSTGPNEDLLGRKMCWCCFKSEWGTRMGTNMFGKGSKLCNTGKTPYTYGTRIITVYIQVRLTLWGWNYFEINLFIKMIHNFDIQHIFIQNYISHWSALNKEYNGDKKLGIWRNMSHWYRVRIIILVWKIQNACF